MTIAEIEQMRSVLADLEAATSGRVLTAMLSGPIAASGVPSTQPEQLLMLAERVRGLSEAFFLKYVAEEMPIPDALAAMLSVRRMRRMLEDRVHLRFLRRPGVKGISWRKPFVDALYRSLWINANSAGEHRRLLQQTAQTAFN